MAFGMKHVRGERMGGTKGGTDTGGSNPVAMCPVAVPALWRRCGHSQRTTGAMQVSNKEPHGENTHTHPHTLHGNRGTYT